MSDCTAQFTHYKKYNIVRLRYIVVHDFCKNNTLQYIPVHKFVYFRDSLKPYMNCVHCVQVYVLLRIFLPEQPTTNVPTSGDSLVD